jgi:ABC-type polysaccharide/polyol phosphate export permease
LVISAFQVIALVGASVARGATFSTSLTGWLWAVGAVIGIAMLMHGFAEILAARIKKQEEYVGAAPPVALLPWFLAGSFFPIGAMPAGLTAFAKVLPVTHALALLRYGLVDRSGRGLHDIWGMSNTSAMATLSLGVVAVFAFGVLAISTRVFTRAAIS